MSCKILRTIITLCFPVLLAGCPPQFTPPHSPVLAPPQLNDTSFISFDGTVLPLQRWLPSGGMEAAKVLFIAVHGFNDYSNFIKKGAEFFVARNIAVYSYDQRGFGKAPVRGRWSSTGTMAEDLRTLVRLMTERYPTTRTYLLGHSMGGAVVIQAMAGEDHPGVSGAILVSPAVWARSTMPFYQTGVLWLAAHTIPWYRVTGEILDRHACSDNNVLQELGSDPLVIKETRFDTIYGLQNLMDDAFASADRFRLPSLVLYGRHDEIIPQEPVLDAYKRFPLAPGSEKQLILYENGYHMLLRDLHGEDVMHDIVAWVNI